MKRRLFALVLIAGLFTGLFSHYGTLEVRADYDFSDTTFIGDSRTKTMGTGGRYEYALLPDSDIYATWAVLTTEKPAFDDAWMAGYQKRPKAVFWYGINDVQIGDREDADDFVRHVEDLIITFREENETAQVYILSVLTTTPQEQDYYEGQNENIRRYNERLAAFCANNGHIFVDITDLYSDSYIIEGDNIHFKREWYTDKFLPRMDAVLHAAPTPPPTEAPTEPQTEAPTEPQTEPQTDAPVTDAPQTEPAASEESTEAVSTEEVVTTAEPTTQAVSTTAAPATTEKGMDDTSKTSSPLKTILIILGTLLLAALIGIGWISYRNQQARKRRRNSKRHYSKNKTKEI